MVLKNVVAAQEPEWVQQPSLPIEPQVRKYTREYKEDITRRREDMNFIFEW